MTRAGITLVVPALIILAATVIGAGFVGTWPPFVAVDGGSMEPSVERGDLVVVTAVDRFPWGGLTGSDDVAPPSRLGGSGDVVVYMIPASVHGGNTPHADGANDPIFHRIAFSVDAGEDWTERADPMLLSGTCDQLTTCPAPHDGYITYGDANGEYDQSAGVAPVVKPAWIHGQALVAVPLLGWLSIGGDAALDRYGAGVTTLVLISIAGVIGGVTALFAGRVRRRFDR